jgi:hypothetical protein
LPYRLCKCGLHHTHLEPYPARVSLTVWNEYVCTTKPGDGATSYEPGRRYAKLTIRLPYWLGSRWVDLRVWWSEWRIAHGLKAEPKGF